jgi:uncharacterized protein YaaR (DUF327 family)
MATASEEPSVCTGMLNQENQRQTFSVITVLSTGKHSANSIKNWCEKLLKTGSVLDSKRSLPVFKNFSHQFLMELTLGGVFRHNSTVITLNGYR